MKENVSLAAAAVAWLLGWMPRGFLKNIETIKEKINDEFFVNSDDEDDDGLEMGELQQDTPAGRRIKFADP